MNARRFRNTCLTNTVIATVFFTFYLSTGDRELAAAWGVAVWVMVVLSYTAWICEDNR